LASNEPLSGPNRLRRAADGSARRSGAKVALFWTFALVFGLSTALFIARYLERNKGMASSPTVKIAVAAAELPLAVKIAEKDWKLAEWPKDHLPPGVITDAKELEGRILTTRVIAEQPIVRGMLAAKEAGNGLAALIPPDMRAIAVRVDDVVGVAGFIHPEDRVDVLVTLRPNRPNLEPTTKVFLQNVKVLAVGQEVDNQEKSRLQTSPATVATLLVSPPDSERLALAAAEGKLVLTLRTWMDAKSVETGGASPSGLLGNEPVAQNAPAPAAQPSTGSGHHSRAVGRTVSMPVVAMPTAEAPKQDVVEILRGDRFEKRNFKQ
jgi:pilus assembly protein CpaB